MILLSIIIILICLGFSSFFSSADICFSSVNKLKLEKEVKKGNKKAKRVLEFVNNYSKTISTILFGNNLVNIIASSFGAVLALELFPNLPIGPVIIEIILLILVITFGEILPKSFSKPYAYQLSMLYVDFIRILRVIFSPFTWFSSRISSFFCKPFLSKKRNEIISDEELESMVEDIEEEGIIDESASELLHRSIEFKDTSAHEIMTPRIAIFGVDYKENLSQWVKNHLPLTKSRIIVYKDNADNIVGYIPSKSLLKRSLIDNNIELNDVLLPILAIPATMEISSVLKLMKKSHHHIAVVKDEYGGTDGILTLEDILEELVGEMFDENDKVSSFIQETNRKNVFKVSGKIDIDNFFKTFNLNKEKIDEDYSTLSGWIIDKLGRFAVDGDTLSFEKVDIKVTKTYKFTIAETTVVYHPRRK